MPDEKSTSTHGGAEDAGDPAENRIVTLDRVLYDIATKESKERGETAWFIGGEHPGWFFGMYRDPSNPFRMELDDVYLYSAVVKEVMVFFSVHGSHGLVDQGKGIIDLGSSLFAIIYHAFEQGASKVEVRPFSELPEHVVGDSLEPGRLGGTLSEAIRYSRAGSGPVKPLEERLTPMEGDDEAPADEGRGGGDG